MKKNIKLLAAFTLALCCLFTAACTDDPDDTTIEAYQNTQTIAYVPMDDRPVNVDRAVYLTESLDYTLTMPDSDLYQTHLDNQKVNSNGTQYGDREAILQWLKETDADCYALSLDQMLSGGLVQARITAETDLTETFAIIDEIFTIIGDKPAVLFDMVLRFASTVGYNGYGQTEYDGLRSYGTIARQTLSGDDLTVDNIVAGYRYDANGDEIETTLPDSVISEHLAARERKLRIADYVLEKAAEKSNIYLYYGVGDSSANVSIQTNEISYIEGKLNNGTLFAGGDEMGIMAITKLYTQSIGQEISANLTYIGGGEGLEADEYDTGTLSETMSDHLDSLNITLDENAELQIVVLTQPITETNKYYNTTCDEAAEYIISLEEAQKPVIVIDASTTTWYGRLQYQLTSQNAMGLLLGYSNWNTTANAIGCALANGVSRYLYLKYAEVTDEGNDGFLKTLTFSFVKDISYKIVSQVAITQYVKEVGSTDNFYSALTDEDAFNEDITEIMLTSSNTCGATGMIAAINSSQIITDLKTYTLSSHKTVSVSDFYFPWYRTFEMSFTITLA